MPFKKALARRTVSYSSKGQDSKTRGSFRIACFLGRHGNRCNAKSIDNNLATEARGKYKAEDAATKSTARQ